MPHRCAILDDYQNVALKLADWAKIKEVEVKVFNEHLGHHPDNVRVSLRIHGPGAVPGGPNHHRWEVPRRPAP